MEFRSPDGAAVPEKYPNKCPMAEFNRNLWAPWRMEYIRSLAEDVTDEGCFLCRYWSDPGGDQANHIVWRSDRVFAVMNRFPYTNGHLLIAYAQHGGDIETLPQDDLLAMSQAIRDAVALLRHTIKPQGFNIGYNIGHCAGAGLPGHLHAHVVPRWSGDTNFMAVIDNTRTIPDSLDALHAELTAQAAALGLR